MKVLSNLAGPCDTMSAGTGASRNAADPSVEHRPTAMKLETRTLNRTRVFVVTLFAAAPCTLLVTQCGTTGRQIVRGADNSQAGSAPVPVERNMHEFMEYVLQPTYKRLKHVMAAAPAGKQEWKSIKSDALILAEGGNLLLLRKSEKSPGEWTEFSVGVRDAGGQLYRAATQKDFSASRNAYERMLSKCNSCHTRFAGGKHQLAL
jgi:hypothetical protein